MSNSPRLEGEFSNVSEVTWGFLYQTPLQLYSATLFCPGDDDDDEEDSNRARVMPWFISKWVSITKCWFPPLLMMMMTCTTAWLT